MLVPFLTPILLFLVLFFDHTMWLVGSNRVPQLGIQIMLPTVEVKIPNHWTTRELPVSDTL